MPFNYQLLIINYQLSMEFRYQQGDTSHAVRIIQKGDTYQVLIGDRRYDVSARDINPHTLDLLIDGRYLRATHATTGNARWVEVGDAPVHATRLLQRRQRRAKGGGSGSLAATMPGQVTAVLVAVGDVVTTGQILVLMEAMKMEMRIVAPGDGTVGKVLVAQGDQVERGQVLVEMAGTDS
jgi:3-methylcrotonyl-CoA carboxylase alpha subunit